MKEVFIIGGARTPFGSFGGSLKEVPAEDLAVTASAAAIQRAGIEGRLIDNVVFGNVVQSSPNAAYFARHVGLRAGTLESTPALTVNRLCGSGLQAAVSAAESIMLGYSEIGLAGGAESMSRIPYSMHASRFGFGTGTPIVTDMLWATLKDEYAGCGMGDTAENLADDYGISREEQDEFAFRSHQKAEASREQFAKEITPVIITSKRGNIEVTLDEHIRPSTTLEKLASLKPTFRRDGTVTAGNASGINDGAAAVVLAGGEAVKNYGLKPIAQIIGYGIAGVDPTRMGIGPVPALEKAFKRSGLTINDMDVVEINEAFAAQTLAVKKVLSIPDEKLNPLGGAIALGHPVGASGARLLFSAALQLQRNQGRYAVVSLCIGGGQGIAMIIERT